MGAGGPLPTGSLRGLMVRLRLSSRTLNLVDLATDSTLSLPLHSILPFL